MPRREVAPDVPAPAPSPFLRDLPVPPAEPPSLVVLAEELEALRTEVASVDARLVELVEAGATEEFFDLDDRARALPSLIVAAELTLLTERLAWLQTLTPPLRALAQQHIDRQDAVFTEQERLNEELARRAEVIAELSGRIDWAHRQMGQARQRRQELRKAQVAARFRRPAAPVRASRGA